ncbi:Fur family transcriptional regulator [Corynebacterium glyciniphilum]|uniref:Fur family transcriptional regulator n=1 Tax=Corynebacterium glyciniphilum TaxID=1404244 RepID=UPI00264CC410|nr:transcriptional repressor [Corynebacterium glyciniphilum]MDN5682767.1 transcriptional repressor [Corynebacterium glyciniphilum]MDN6706667.1 transcriptional repressor [Corynebacterium glyciniphilum]
MRTDPTASWAEQVRQLGLRATPGRVASLRYLHDHPHSTAAQVHSGISAELPTVSMQSVHNVVNDLSARGLLRRIDLPGGGAARFETNREDNHHHIQCVVCGRLEDVECVVGHAPCLTPADGHGMHTVLSAEVMFRAICTDCAATENTHSPTHTQTHTQEKIHD